MIRRLARALARSLSRRLTPQAADAAFEKLAPVPPHAPYAAGKPATVAALQVAARSYPDAGSLVADIDRYMSTAREKGAGLVCFPELFGLLPLTLVPLVRLALRFYKGDGAADPAPTQPTPPEKEKHRMVQLFGELHVLTERYSAIMGRFAARYGVYLSAGTLFVEEEGKVYNRHLFFGPDGGQLAKQDKMHLVTEEIGMGMATADSLAVVQTPVGNIALTVCMDATYFETFRIAKHLGADYAVVPIGNVEPFDHWLALRGAQSRVSETGLTAVKAALVDDPATGGEAAKKYRLRVGLTGRAGVYLPLQSGVDSAEYRPPSPDPAVCATLDLKKLRGMHSDIFCLRNKAFDQRYLSALLHYKKHSFKEVQ